MISLSGAVTLLVWLLIAGLVFALLWWLVTFVGGKIGGEGGQKFTAFGQIAVVVLAVLVLIGFLLSLVGGPAFIRL